MRAEDLAAEVNGTFANGRVSFTADRLLEAREVADRLAVPVSWVRSETRAGRMPCVELGRYRRYQWEAVTAWLEGQRSGQWRTHKPKGTR